jgi:cell division protein ZapA (FtsZ GTPase activity inhibitor)
MEKKKTLKEKITSFFKWLGAILLGALLAIGAILIGYKPSEREKELEDEKKDIEEENKEIEEKIKENNKKIEKIKKENEGAKEHEKKFFPNID